MEYYVKLNEPKHAETQIDFAYTSKGGDKIKGKYYSGWNDVQSVLELFGCELDDYPEIEPDLTHPFTLTISPPRPS